ncbi:MAG: helix-turn-helix transcriptional regulator [Clostridiales bacterium]|nr:helix-turn-helix transcriptional regulator [Clostridiales bacterium]
MDQLTIGKFIKALRKEQGWTQSELAEKLNVSDKTVSKWETGKGLPEVSLMMPLCRLLGISVNELLSGERLSETQYHQKAEENIMSLMEERKKTKKKIWVAVLTTLITLIPTITLLWVVGEADIPEPLRYVLLAIGFFFLISGLIVCGILDLEASVYECKACGERFVPKFGSYIMGVHGIRWRRLRCPKCGKKTFCTRHLTKEKE